MKTEQKDEVSRWYAIQTHLQQEERAYSNLEAWGLYAFSPRLRKGRANQFTGVVTYSGRPMFPRYIFARFDAERLLHKVCYTRGVKNVVCFGGSPMPIDDEVITLLQARVGADGYVKLGGELQHGDRIVITGGPLKDFAGVFERGMKDSERVMVLLTTISYQGRLSVDRELVRKVA